ncbi:hypothetical protein QFC21_007037 [Naganishia friedmannii]|uniref:Uncharacterized protein n=1 Tax=Naganishia friedmannii TaxID=89922 RepID=A0ACC2UY95_9TREE|nr:hypothetical protein QFC21_007037 [Naganishia friedmannii]
MAIPMPNWQPSKISATSGDAINSTAAFEKATHLEAQAYQANRWVFVGIMIVLVWCIFAQLPHTVVRMRWASTIWDGFRLRASRQSQIIEGKVVESSTISPSSTTARSDVTRTENKPPRRLQHLRLSLPIHTIPFLNLPLPQFVVVAFVWAIGLGVAAWSQTAFLTQASRSTLVVMAIMSLTAAFGAKAFGVGTWLQIGYTAVNFLHRWLGRMVILLSTLHVIAYLVVFYRAGVFMKEMALPANYLSAVAYGGLLLIGLASMRPIRQRWWWAFKFGHHFGILLVLAGLNYHSGDTVPYLIAIWGLILVNTIFRSVTTRYTFATLRILPGAESTLITFPALTRGFTPGQHVRIRMWSLLTTKNSGMSWRNAMESHPFSLSTPSEVGMGVQLVVKCAGDWTRAVYELAQRNPGGVDVRCSIEGPYAGGPLNFMFPAFASVLVVVGGSGISFGLGVIQGLLSNIRQGKAACTKLSLVWIVRDRENLEALEYQLRSVIDIATSLGSSRSDFHLSLILCFTSRSHADSRSDELEGDSPKLNFLNDIESSSLSVKILNSRPELREILTGIVKVTLRGGVGVGVCGPSGLVQSVEKHVRALPKAEKKRVDGVEVHAEAFSL